MTPFDVSSYRDCLVSAIQRIMRNVDVNVLAFPLSSAGFIAFKSGPFSVKSQSKLKL